MNLVKLDRPNTSLDTGRITKVSGKMATIEYGGEALEANAGEVERGLCLGETVLIIEDINLQYSNNFGYEL
jgi:hypothetical protein